MAVTYDEAKFERLCTLAEGLNATAREASRHHQEAHFARRTKEAEINRLRADGIGENDALVTKMRADVKRLDAEIAKLHRASQKAQEEWESAAGLATRLKKYVEQLSRAGTRASAA